VLRLYLKQARSERHTKCVGGRRPRSSSALVLCVADADSSARSKKVTPSPWAVDVLVCPFLCVADVLVCHESLDAPQSFISACFFTCPVVAWGIYSTIGDGRKEISALRIVIPAGRAGERKESSVYQECTDKELQTIRG